MNYQSSAFINGNQTEQEAKVAKESGRWGDYSWNNSVTESPNTLNKDKFVTINNRKIKLELVEL